LQRPPAARRGELGAVDAKSSRELVQLSTLGLHPLAARRTYERLH
jgi:hypothetical protein